MRKAASYIIIALLIFLASSFHFIVLGKEELETKVHPDLLLITLDTTRADHLGCYGASFANTPNLDALSRSGTRFDHALSPAPLTLPSHASLLTGLVPRRHGVRDNALYKLDSSIPLLTEKLRLEGYSTAAFISAVVLDRQVGLNRGFLLYDDTVRIGERSFFNYEERAASQVTDAVLAYIDDLGSPFFLWVHYFDPHLPYVPPEPYHTRFKDRLYDGEIAFMDQEIGRLLEAIRKRSGKLIVVVAGDHGESLGEHGEAAHDIFIYNATQRVPLIFEGQGIPSGKVIERNVGLIDVAPTILDLIALPPLEGIEGQSLLPLIKGNNIPPPDYEMESFYPHFAYGWAPLRGLVRKNLKYIEAPHPELYDLRIDPSEIKDLSSLRKKEVKKLAKVLRKIVKNDKMSPQNLDADLLEQRRRLESLGYVSGSGSRTVESLIDPKDGIKWISDLDSARRELQLGDPRKAVPSLERLLNKNPDNIPARITLAQCHLAAGDTERAIILTRQTVSFNSENDLTHFNLANALAEKGREDPKARAEAYTEYERVLALNPRHVDAYLNYVSLLILDKKHEEAYHLLKRARMAGVEGPEIETKLGFLEMARGSASLARNSFERAISLNPLASKAFEGLGRIAYAEGRFSLAEEYFARALEISPSAALARVLGSIRLRDLNDVEGARQAYLKALELSPPDDPHRKELLDILNSLNNIQDAPPIHD